MKRKPIEAGLFDAEENPLLYGPEDVAPPRCDCTGFHPDYPFRDTRGAFNHCTLDGKPARIIGGPSPYATIEPVDIDDEPICCEWNVVADVLTHRDGAFCRSDDDSID
jgi:hypothetical protein